MRSTLLALVALVPLVAGLASALDRAPAQEAGPAPAAAADPLERVAILGASASVGFNLEQELNRKVRLEAFIRAATDLAPEAILDAADWGTFLDPTGKTWPALERVREYEPTVTLAIDLPFWFVHGNFRPRNRVDGLLERLDEFPGVLVLGTVPFLGETVSKLMITPSQRAEREVVEAANAALKVFADGREEVVLLPLAEIFAAMQEGESPGTERVEVHPDDVEDLLQADGIHPNVMGTAVMALRILEAVDAHFEGRIGERVDWDVDALVDAIESADG